MLRAQKLSQRKQDFWYQRGRLQGETGGQCKRLLVGSVLIAVNMGGKRKGGPGPRNETEKFSPVVNLGCK